MRLKRPAVLVIAPVLIAAALVTFGAGAAPAQTSPCTVSTADQAADAEEQSLLGLVNQYRATNGLPALTAHPTVTKAAAWFSRDMASKNYFPPNHVDSNGRGIPARLTWCGVAYSNYAENIYAGRPDVQSVFTAWRNSSTHNSNMLRSGVTSAGIARAYQAGSTYGWYWTLDVTNSAPAATTTTTRPPTTTIPTTTTRPVPHHDDPDHDDPDHDDPDHDDRPVHHADDAAVVVRLHHRLLAGAGGGRFPAGGRRVQRRYVPFELAGNGHRGPVLPVGVPQRSPGRLEGGRRADRELPGGQRGEPAGRRAGAVGRTGRG